MGRRSREKRARRAASTVDPDAPRAAQRRRALVRAILVAAIVGFGAGWIVRMWLDRTPESAARETAERIREQARGTAR